MARSERSLFLLPFDHRESFEIGLFGWKGALSDVQTSQIAAAKELIYEVAIATTQGAVPLEQAGVLVDEQFGSTILRDARRRGIVTASSAEKSSQAEFI